MPGAAAWGAGVWQGPKGSTPHQGTPLPSQGCDEDMLWRWGMCQMWGWPAADGTVAEQVWYPAWMDFPVDRVEVRIAAPGSFQPKLLKYWGGGGERLVVCVLHVIQSPVRESPCKIWYSKSALLCPCFGSRPWMSEGGIFSCSESGSLSEPVWAHGAEPVCRSWCCTCSSVRCPIMKKFSFQHCQVSTSPTSDTMAGVVLSQWQSSHHRNCTYNLTSFRVYQELCIFGMFNGILICKVRSLQ